MSQAATFADLVRATQTGGPEVALVLGSGLGLLASRCRIEMRLPYVTVPGLAAPTVEGHAGSLALAEWAGKRVLLLEGRLHYYEGHPRRNVLEPIRIAHFLGARILLLTNAAGGIHDELAPGRLMAIRDHIDWTRSYCWQHPGPGGCGPARPIPYSGRLLQGLRHVAQTSGVQLHAGIYAAVTGPCYETPAEIRALRTWGADAVGMSTAHEAQLGFELGMEVAALSLITNRAAGLNAGPIHHKEVLTMAAAKMEQVADFLERLFVDLDR